MGIHICIFFFIFKRSSLFDFRVQNNNIFILEKNDANHTKNVLTPCHSRETWTLKLH